MAEQSNSKYIRALGTSATEHVVNSLTKLILNGTYRPGDRLVENRLVAEFGVGRGAVREALRQLHADELIDHAQNRGAVVRLISRKDIIEMLVIRETLEGLAASLAAQHVDKNDNRQRVIEELARLSRSISDRTGIDFQENNNLFHQFIIELGGNATLGRQIDQLQKPAVRSWFFNQVSDDDWLSSLSEHQLILKAILDGDEALSEHLMRAHIRRVRKILESLPDELFEINKSLPLSEMQAYGSGQN